MLNPFPELLVLSFLAPTILRVFLGGAFIYRGIRALGKEKGEIAKSIQNMPFMFGSSLAWVTVLGVVEILSGILLIVGLYVQIAALAVAILSVKTLFWKTLGHTLSSESRLFYMMVLAISVSLMLTGAGLFAFDLPL